MAKQYKKPENVKYKSRKDLKDYTMDDKKGGMNPKASGEKLPNLLRKTDKDVIDDGTYDIKWNADDRLYTDLEDGEYDPKTALKRLKKRQDTDEKLSKDQLKDKIENLTREQKERIVREYVRRKIEHILIEQATPEEEPITPEEPIAPDPTADPAAAMPQTQQQQCQLICLQTQPLQCQLICPQKHLSIQQLQLRRRQLKHHRLQQHRKQRCLLKLSTLSQLKNLWRIYKKKAEILLVSKHWLR